MIEFGNMTTNANAGYQTNFKQTAIVTAPLSYVFNTSAAFSNVTIRYDCFSYSTFDQDYTLSIISSMYRSNDKVCTYYIFCSFHTMYTYIEHAKYTFV